MLLNVCKIGLVNKCFNINLDIKEIVNITLNSESENQLERNKAKNAYDFIYSYYKNNTNKFDIKIKNSDVIQKVDSGREGIVMYCKDKTIHISIQNNILRNILVQNNFTQLDNYKVKWKNLGYIQCENNRYDMSNVEIGRHFHFVYKNLDDKEFDILGDSKSKIFE